MPPDIVLIEWIDACQHTRSDEDDIGTPIYSVGFLLRDDPAGYRLCPAYAPDADWDDFLDIPRAYVESVTFLGPS